MSEKKTKQLICIDCGATFIGSLYASPKTARCDECKKNKRGAKSRARKVEGAMIGANVAIQNFLDTKPVQVTLYRNRQDIEADVVVDTGEVFSRIPAKWQVIENSLDYLSVSKVNSFNQCKHKFFLENMVHDGKDRDNGNIFTWFGSILHEVMDEVEKIYQTGITLDIKGIRTIYDNAWQRHELSDLPSYKEGWELIKNFFKVHPIGSLPYKTIATELEWRGKLSDIIEDVPEELKDMDFGCQFDYIGEIDSETAILKDYKTNRHPFTHDELIESLQLQVYEVILRKLYPQYKKWVTGYELFRFGWQPCPIRTKDDLDMVKAFIINTAIQIKREQKWEPKLHALCPYCNHCEECEAYMEYVRNPEDVVAKMVVDETNMESIMEAHDQFSAMEKIAKSRKDGLAKAIKAKIEQDTLVGNKCIVGDKEVYLKSQSRPTYNYYAVRDVMAVAGKLNELDKCVSINKGKIDKLAKDDPQLALELERCKEEKYSSPYIMKRKVK